ncbi:MAG: bifunctional phosphoglucose/phosphomannose isomerase [Actinomycetota bacterium]
MIELDDGSLLASNDPQGFIHSVEHLVDQLAEGWELGRDLAATRDGAGLRSIAVFGVGGSGICGDVLKVVLGSSSPLMVEVCRGYGVPGWVGPDTLVFAVSYSGRTEETLEAYEQARQAGARIVVVTTGGPLAELGRRHGLPIALLRDGLQPRAALGLMLTAMLGVCESLGLGDYDSDVQETAALIKRRAIEYGSTRPTDQNRAKQLAAYMVGLLPVVYGSEGLAQVAAYRWKCQFNECAKTNAYSNFFSELNHNEIMGWSPSGIAPPMKPAVVVLRHCGEHPRIQDRISITLPLIADRLGVVEEVWAEGNSELARVMDLIYLGDFVATYTALAQGIDPCGVDLIDEVKRRLSI